MTEDDGTDRAEASAWLRRHWTLVSAVVPLVLLAGQVAYISGGDGAVTTALVTNAQLTPVLTALVVSSLPTVLLLLNAVMVVSNFEDIGLPVRLRRPAASVLGATDAAYLLAAPWTWAAVFAALIALLVAVKIVYPRWARWVAARPSTDKQRSKRADRKGRIVDAVDIKMFPWLLVVMLLFQGAFGITQPWIPREVVYEHSGAVLVGYVLRSDDPLVFVSSNGGVRYINRTDIANRQPCNIVVPAPSLVGLGNHFGGERTLVCPKSHP